MFHELERRCPTPVGGVRDHLIDNEPRDGVNTDSHDSDADGGAVPYSHQRHNTAAPGARAPGCG
ncbi:MAG: hypothetical protein F4129_13555 [Acidimicrobiia bacterium]|nr:hypothetical protein [Acidimicrobiia bacterium]